MTDLTPEQRAYMPVAAPCRCDPGALIPEQDCPRHQCEPCNGSGIVYSSKPSVVDNCGDPTAATGLCRACYGARADAYGGLVKP